ncbi:MAG: EamA family transporter [Anaerolineaceae bacterium]|nr:EamA family transporter [Anaerolineaceae bacterium]
MSKKDWIQFSAISLLWGSQYLWVKIVLQETGSITMTAIRLLAATVGIIIYHRFTRPKYPSKIPWGAFLFLGLFNLSVPLALVALSEVYITSGMASVLNSTSPLFTMMFGWFLLDDEPFSLVRLVGLSIGFGGVILLLSEKLNTGGNGFLLGAGAMLLAAISYAIAAVFARRHTTHLHYSVQALGQVMVGAAVALPAAIIIEAPFTLPRQPATWTGILVLGLLLTTIGSNLFFSLLNSIGPTRTLMISYLYPLVGIVLGILFLNEEISLQLLTGGALIIGGIILANSRLQFPLRVQK